MNNWALYGYDANNTMRVRYPIPKTSMVHLASLLVDQGVMHPNDLKHDKLAYGLSHVKAGCLAKRLDVALLPQLSWQVRATVEY